MMSSPLVLTKALFAAWGLHFQAAPAQPGSLSFSQLPVQGSNSIPRHSDILEYQEEHELP